MNDQCLFQKKFKMIVVCMIVKIFVGVYYNSIFKISSNEWRSISFY